MLSLSVCAASVLAMMLLPTILEGGSSAVAQTRITQGEPAPFDGWILTGPDLQEIRKGLLEQELLEQSVAERDTLIALYQTRLGVLRSLIYEQRELIDEYADFKSPGLFAQMTDRGTLAALAIIGSAVLVKSAE